MAIIAAYADRIALIGHDVNERVLPVEPAQSGVTLPNCLARFDGEAERERVRKSKAHDGCAIHGEPQYITARSIPVICDSR